MHKTGLILGKFMPLHNGHIALFDFAKERCDTLIILLCSEDQEVIDGNTRYQWLLSHTQNEKGIKVVHYKYDPSVLPNTSISSEITSALWAEAIIKILPPVDIVFSSEEYGAYLARYLNCSSLSFDIDRRHVPVSGSAIRKSPFAYWDFLPVSVRPYFVKKICIVGSESTGKSTLAEKVAAYFNTTFVPEVARDIVSHTNDVVFDDLANIAMAHAERIKTELQNANKILILDTDLNITRSYALYLFGKELIVDNRIREINRSELYLFLEPDCPFIQDGTRMELPDRNKLSVHHKKIFNQEEISLNLISGDWEQRFVQAVEIITKKMKEFE